MNPYRQKPEIKINEFLLLVTIYLYLKQHGIPPSAEVLMGLKADFAPSLTRVDTLRTWLYRHKGRVIKRVNDCRPYRYELSRQGYRRIQFLVMPFFEKAISMKKLGVPVDYDMIRLYFTVKDFLDPMNDIALFRLLLKFLTTSSITF